MRLEFNFLATLLRKRADSPDVFDLIQYRPDEIERIEYQGYVAFKDKGVSLMFKEAPWVIPASEIVDEKALYLDAFHFHRFGHENNVQYAGSFPNDVAFNDNESVIVQKLGQPLSTGGGGESKIIKKVIQRWLKYRLSHAMVHFQLDSGGKLDMVTLYSEDLQQLKS